MSSCSSTRRTPVRKISFSRCARGPTTAIRSCTRPATCRMLTPILSPRFCRGCRRDTSHYRWPSSRSSRHAFRARRHAVLPSRANASSTATSSTFRRDWWAKWRRSLLDFFDARKHPWQMARLVSPGILVRFLFRRLGIGHIEAHAHGVLGVPALAVRRSPPELAFDADTIDDYRYVSAHE